MRPPTIPTTIPIGRDDSKQIVIMKSLYNSLIEFREPKTHRILIQLFMCLPSRKDFPEYFNIIAKPIAMNKIRDRIERQLYPDEESCLDDFKLMFSNCKFFNEDDSQIYNDAVQLELMLKRRREELHIEYNRPSRDSKSNNADGEAILNATTTTTTTTTTTNTTHNNTANATATNNVNNAIQQQNPNNLSPSIKSDRLNNSNHSSNANNNHATDKNSSTAAININSPSISMDHSDDTPSQQKNNQTNITTTTNNNSNNIKSSEANADGGSSSGSNSNHNIISSYHTSHLKADHSSSTNPSTPKKSSNGIANIRDTTITQQSDSTNYSSSDQQNGNELDSSNLRVNHNHHNDTSMDSSSNLSADLLASTPIEKCSLNTRRGRNSDAPKRQLLTGYIIYASEIRKQVIDKNPNQNFGDISRLVGNEWKALPHDIRSKYDQRALIHNKRVRERAQRDLNSTDRSLTNGLQTPKLTKRKLAKLAKEQMRQHHLSLSGHHDESSTRSPRISQERSSNMVSQTPSSNKHHQSHQHSQPQTNAHQVASSKGSAVESSTQTIAIRFVEPPTRKRLVYSDTFRKYIESLEVPNRDLLAEETTPERPAELPTHWLGAGIGRHESPEAALWALRDFMLQDAVAMRRSMEPYL